MIFIFCDAAWLCLLWDFFPISQYQQIYVPCPCFWARTKKLWGMFIRVEEVYILLWSSQKMVVHDDVIKWKHFPRYWPFVRRIHRSPVTSPHKGKWRGALMFSLICVWINGWVNNREAGDLRHNRAHYYVTVMVNFLALQTRHYSFGCDFIVNERCLIDITH